MQRVPTERDQTGEATKQRGGALDGHMGTAFLTRHVQAPARQNVPDDLLCWLGGVRGNDVWGGACLLDHA